MYEEICVDAVYDDSVSMTAYPSAVILPTFANNNFHPGSLSDLDPDKAENVGLNQLHDQYVLRWIDATGTPDPSNAIVKGGQDKRMQIVEGPAGNAYDKHGWDMDAVLIVEDLGKVSNTGWDTGAPAAGVKDVDYTDTMRIIAKKVHGDMSELKYAGPVTLRYIATQIRPGHKVRFEDHKCLSDAELYVSQVQFNQNGTTQLTIGEPGADYITEQMSEIQMAKERRYYDIMTRASITGSTGSGIGISGGDSLFASTGEFTYSYHREGLAAVADLLDQTFKCPATGTISALTIGARTAPTGADLILELYEDGGATGTTYTLPIGDTTASFGSLTVAVSATSLYTFKVTQKGSTYAGESVYAVITYTPA